MVSSSNTNSSSSSSDSRFQSVLTSPIFKKNKTDKFKVKVDERFQSLLKNESFQSFKSDSSSKMDQYGRKQQRLRKGKKTSSKAIASNDILDYYDVESDAKVLPVSSGAPSSTSITTSADNNLPRLDYLTKLARGEISGDSSDASSSSDGELDDSDDADDDASSESSDNADKVELDQQQPSSNQRSALSIPYQTEPELSADIQSNRLAIQNCDWENVSAQDLMMILLSFGPTGSTAVRKVTVYVSDFGRKCMDIEAEYGPRGIWATENKNTTTSSRNNNSSLPNEGEDDQEDNDDLYDNIVADEDDEDEEDGDDDEDSNEGLKNGIRKAALEGDFQRKNGVVGLVLHDDLLRLGKASSADSQQAKGSNHRASSSAGLGFDEVALRKYELSKLRYYFAIAECESSRICNMLYEELDEVELEHSSMVLDLSIVPDDICFEGRQVRDVYSNSSSGSSSKGDLLSGKYKPPSFIVDALQHTSVECSWDTDKQREKKLTNFSLWRNLNESELQQYVASSNSDDSEEDEEEKEEGEGKNAKSKMKSMRRMLLGDELAGSSGSDSELEKDDFFNPADEEFDHASSSSAGGGGGGGGDLEMTYIPELEHGFKNHRESTSSSSSSEHKMTPYEIDQKKAADRKKARKLAKKNSSSSISAEKPNPDGGVVTIVNEDRSNDQLELLMADDVGYEGSKKDDFDMREIELREKEQQKRSKKQKRKGKKKMTISSSIDPSSTTTTATATAPEEEEDTFKLDVTDTRFSKLFQGDPRFGIDKTANEFRSTPATAEILKVQIKNRVVVDEDDDDGYSHSGDGGLEKEVTAATHKKEMTEKSVNVSSLINNLKRKFG